jgi:hypothetical protein
LEDVVLDHPGAQRIAMIETSNRLKKLRWEDRQRQEESEIALSKLFENMQKSIENPSKDIFN